MDWTQIGEEHEINASNLPIMGRERMVHAAFELLRRQGDDPDSSEDAPEASQKEVFSSWALLILIVLLIAAFFTSYVLSSRKIQAVHETVMSIFAGMVIGLILRIVGVESVLDSVSFDYQFFFNLLLPPIILAAGYELHQVRRARQATFRHPLTPARRTFFGTSERS